MDTIYYGGDIITMEEAQPFVQAILVRDGLIAKSGALEEVRAAAAADAYFLDLRGCTLMPSFIDAHSHITAYAQTMGMLDLGDAHSFEDLGGKLRKYAAGNGVKQGEWVVAHGYDHNRLKEGRHPDKTVLDHFLPENPVLITHASGHMGVLNSAALQETGITPVTADPEGGKIGRMPDGREPNGYLEETAFIKGNFPIPEPALEQKLHALEKAQKGYLQYGITTVQDGLTHEAEWKLLCAASALGRLKVDVVSYIDQNADAPLLWQHPVWVRQYVKHLKIGGYKLILDGSPQGRTAWMSKPYQDAEDGYCGYPVYSDGQVSRFFEAVLQDSLQVLVHCNGDAAAQQMLSVWERLVDKLNVGLRPVMIHAQFVRADQLRRMQRLGIIASFFMDHVYYWSSAHRKNMGNGRACEISPARSAIEAGTVYTFHQDTPVLPPDMLFTVWDAVNRRDADGREVGAGQCISVMDALRGVTINAAYQYFEEREKGSIRPGKLADLIILDENPLKVPPMQIKDIQVLQTIKEGETLYRREGGLPK